jgi:hypothetical protein
VLICERVGYQRSYSHAGGVRTLDETYSIYPGYPVCIGAFSTTVEVKS